MITVTIDDREVKKLLAALPATASRAAEKAIDQTAKAIKKAIRKELRRVFDRPTPYTLNSLKVTLTKNHNMIASVWFKEPDRMGQHYLVPQVDGGERELKGFERSIGQQQFIPGKAVKLNAYGNISTGQIRQIMSVLGLADRPGYQANVTTKSAKRNTKQRDYVYLPNRWGKLPPGIYRRTTKGVASTAGQRRKAKVGFGTYETGKRKAVVRARGLEPIMLVGRTGASVKPLLDFYGISQRTYDANFKKLFLYHFNTLVRK